MTEEIHVPNPEVPERIVLPDGMMLPVTKWMRNRTFLHEWKFCLTSKGTASAGYTWLGYGKVEPWKAGTILVTAAVQGKSEIETTMRIIALIMEVEAQEKMDAEREERERKETRERLGEATTPSGGMLGEVPL